MRATALTFQGFHLQLRNQGQAARADVAKAKRAIEAAFGTAEGWKLVPVSVAAKEYLVAPAPGQQVPRVSDAWDLARRLAVQKGVVSAEVALAGPGLQPAVPLDALAPTERATRGWKTAKSFLEGPPLPCSRGDYEWSLALSSLKDAWRISPARGEGIIVAHPDTGYTLHPEIWAPSAQRNRILVDEGYDYVTSDPDPLDDLIGGPLRLEFPGHGTSTASVIMSDAGTQVSNGAPFVSGAAPKTMLAPLRVSTSVIHLSFAKLTSAIHRAVDRGHHVISMSLGGPFPSPALERAVKRAVNEGLILLAAAGNYWPWVVWPAAFGDVIAVAACNCNRRPWRFSSSGSAVDFSAPGESVWVARTRKGESNRYTVGQGTGTSFAVGLAAGIAALWLAHHGRDRLISRYGKPNISRIFRHIVATGGVIQPDQWDTSSYGAGIIQADLVLKAKLPYLPAIRKARGPTDPLAAFWNYFPTLSLVDLRRAIAALLRTSEKRVNDALAKVGSELAVHIAMSKALREFVYEHALRRKTSLAKKRKFTWRGDAYLRRMSSTSLRQHLEP